MSFSWTLGIDEALCHVRKIDSGAFGDVHEVPSYLATLNC